MRKFLTFDGEILEETEWQLRPTDNCFYCDATLVKAQDNCAESLDGNHDFITLVNPSSWR